eukprot:TRINITY_DN4247_c0_g1_i1.p1 TRINITY_DN4247_c0_g1~~TRINITY_DN4247_c0_g1_i1.p1  ORF type:complete len:634 (+),score=230.49 TRINITY_DN4247_c0_g1_i1:101-2002(+)
MGFLTEGNTFSWEEASSPPTELVKKYGVIQFLNIYRKSKDRQDDSFKWGDEIEYILLWLNEEDKTARLSLRGHEILDELTAEERLDPHGNYETLWRPEYGRFMVEGTPGGPFTNVNDVQKIEASMRRRRAVVQAKLLPNERLVTVTNFPLLGATEPEFGPFCHPHAAPGGPIAQSLFTPDEIIHPHHRFSTLTANIRNRRGAKVEINVPLFRDERTTAEPLPLPPPASAHLMPSPPQKAYNIYGDSMAFGMGCCCLQVTFQCRDIGEARYVYDQFAVLSPIMLALGAATPIFRGYLADTDVRWHLIAAAVDDRTAGERGERLPKRAERRIPKSRYESASCFISDRGLGARRHELNDLEPPIDDDVRQTLVENGVDDVLASHVAHLFIRDPLVIYRDKLLMDNSLHSDHFENIQSTNWQTVRFKPPPPGGDIGWRVEFRPMELQLSDYENAAFAGFIVLLNRAIVELDLDLYMPLSLVDANMHTALKRDAAAAHKFHFRSSITRGSAAHGDEAHGVELLTIAEIFHGRAGHGGGLLALVREYLDRAALEPSARAVADGYVDFVARKASGEMPTTASWVRQFVTRHADYRRDSVVTPRINYDLMQTAVRIGSGELRPAELFGAASTGILCNGFSH